MSNCPPDGNLNIPAASSITSSANNNTLPVNTTISFTGNITRPANVTADVAGTISITPSSGSSASVSPSSQNITFSGPSSTSATVTGFTTGATAGDVTAKLTVAFDNYTSDATVQVSITST